MEGPNVGRDAEVLAAATRIVIDADKAKLAFYKSLLQYGDPQNKRYFQRFQKRLDTITTVIDGTRYFASPDAAEMAVTTALEMQLRRRWMCCGTASPTSVHLAFCYCVTQRQCYAYCKGKSQGSRSMTTVREAVRELIDPIRHNDLQARRQKLGLSRVALGRILGVDPATVFRREQAVLAPLWDYALRGIEAEARDAKQAVRSFKSRLDHQTFIPDQLAARGCSYAAEKMLEDRERHARTKRRPQRAVRTDETVGSVARDHKATIKAAADRAEARSRLKQR